MSDKEQQYWTLSTLKGRGWTDKMLKEQNIEPDLTRPNPYYKSSPPMKLYLISKIKELEDSEWFMDNTKNREKRQEAARKAAETKREKAMEYVRSLDINLPDLTDEKLFKLAVEHYNDLWMSRGKYDKYIGNYEELDTATLQRICCNFIRHNFTEYEDALDDLFGKTGIQEAHDYLKEKINEPLLRNGLTNVNSSPQ